MKKIIICFIIFLLVIFILVCYMNYKDNNYVNLLKNNIISNTDIKEINYINNYDSYYIIADNENIYLVDNNYELILKKDISLVHPNNNNYDIIYKNKTLMYFNNYIKRNVLINEYYDINTYKLIDRVFVGGTLDE